jgi:hypothetical protein
MAVAVVASGDGETNVEFFIALSFFQYREAVDSRSTLT